VFTDHDQGCCSPWPSTGDHLLAHSRLESRKLLGLEPPLAAHAARNQEEDIGNSPAQLCLSHDAVEICLEMLTLETRLRHDRGPQSFLSSSIPSPAVTCLSHNAVDAGCGLVTIVQGRSISAMLRRYSPYPLLLNDFASSTNCERPMNPMR
jgi:hypothetical protein